MCVFADTSAVLVKHRVLGGGGGEWRVGFSHLIIIHMLGQSLAQSGKEALTVLRYIAGIRKTKLHAGRIPV